MSSFPLARHLAVASAVLALVGCTSDTPTPSGLAGANSPVLSASVSPAAVSQALAALRARTASWHNRAQAEAAGYTTDVGCSDERTEGLSAADARGMGYHTANLEYLLDDHASLLEPELIVYDSDPASGHARMIAFDYFIPGDFYPAPYSQDYPGVAPKVEGIGVPMTWNEAHGGWVVHIWVWKHNKDGMFDNFNPDVPLCACQISPTTNLCTPAA